MMARLQGTRQSLIARIATSCEFHPWCRSYFLVQDHPYMTLTRSDGTFRLTRVPSGTWTLRFWHEACGDITRVPTPDGRLELDVDRRSLDLGEFMPDLRSAH